MSGSLSSLGQQAGAALGLSPLFTDWRSRLRPASFRGVPFLVEGHEETGGRRGVIHEFPLRDGGLTEDLGRPLGRYSIDAYVVGADYDQQRDALRQALYGVGGPGTLVHPWLGTLTVQVLPGCTLRETRDQGGMAIFRLAFVEAATPDLAQTDAAAGVLNAYLPLIDALTAAYAVGVLLATHPGFLLQALTAGLTSFVAGLAGLPVGTVASVVATLAGIGATPTDAAATGSAAAEAVAAVTAATLAAAGVAAVVATMNIGATPTNAVTTGTAAVDAIAAATLAAAPGFPDYSGGLAGLADWSGAVFPAATGTPARQQQATNAQALTDLVRGLAVASVAQIYAQTVFLSAQDAAAARTQLLGLIDARALAAADAGDAASYAAWQTLAGASAADMLARAQSLPALATYQVGAVLPALVLCYRLTGDIADAASLAALNGAVHPLFMPAAGVWLEPAP